MKNIEIKLWDKTKKEYVDPFYFAITGEGKVLWRNHEWIEMPEEEVNGFDIQIVITQTM